MEQVKDTLKNIDLPGERKEPVEFRTGLWFKTSKSGSEYVGGSTQNYWVSYYNNTSPDKRENDPDGNIVLYPKDRDSEEAERNPKGISIKMWKRESKKGLTYLRGKRGYLFMIFANGYKKAPNQPDYILTVKEDGDEKKVYERSGSESHEIPAQQSLVDEPDTVTFESDDIPF